MQSIELSKHLIMTKGEFVSCNSAVSLKIGNKIFLLVYT